MCQLDDYLAIYAERRKELLDSLDVPNWQEYKLAVYATWDISIHMIQNGSMFPYSYTSADALELLQVLCFLDPGGLSEELFRKAWYELRSPATHNVGNINLRVLDAQPRSDGSWNSHRFRTAVDALASFSLVTVGGSHEYLTLSVHPLVHAWTYDRLEEDRRGFLQALTTIFIALTIETCQESSQTLFRACLVPHLDICLGRRGHGRSQGWQDICKTILDLTEQRSFNLCLGLRIALAYTLNHPWEGKQILSILLPPLVEQFGREHKDTMIATDAFASCYRGLYEYQEALRIDNENLDIWTKIHGSCHIAVLQSKNSVAMDLLSIGRFQLAQSMLKDIYVQMKTMSDQSGTSYVELFGMVQNNLATVDDHLGKERAAMEEWKKAIPVKAPDKKRRQMIYPHTIVALFNLGRSYLKEGKYDAGLDFLEESFALGYKILGSDHLLTKSILHNIEYVYRHAPIQGRSEQTHSSRRRQIISTKARDLLEETGCLAIHCLPSTTAPLNETNALACVTARFGREHPMTIHVMANLTHEWLDLGRADAAISLMEETLDVISNVSRSHVQPMLFSLGSQVAHNFSHAGKKLNLTTAISKVYRKQAIEHGTRIYERCRDIYGEENMVTIQTLKMLLMTFDEQDLLKEAAFTCVLMLRGLIKSAGEIETPTLRAKDQLIRLSMKLKPRDTDLGFLLPAIQSHHERKAYSQFGRVECQPSHSNYWTSDLEVFDVVYYYWEWRYRREAKDAEFQRLHRTCLALSELQGFGNVETIHAMYSLAQEYCDMDEVGSCSGHRFNWPQRTKDVIQAVKLLKEVIGRGQRCLTLSLKDLIKCYDLLITCYDRIGRYDDAIDASYERAQLWTKAYGTDHENIQGIVDDIITRELKRESVEYYENQTAFEKVAERLLHITLKTVLYISDGFEWEAWEDCDHDSGGEKRSDPWHYFRPIIHCLLANVVYDSGKSFEFRLHLGGLSGSLHLNGTQFVCQLNLERLKARMFKQKQA
jgi:tetratricopeptide (TPR) repeat protein